MNSVLVDAEFVNNIFKFNPELLSNFSKNQSFGEIFQNLDLSNIDNLSFDQNESHSPQVTAMVDHRTKFVERNESSIISPEIPDFPDDCLKFITDILLEEGLDESPASAREYEALQATEKSLYDVLGEAYPFSENVGSPDDGSSTKSCGGTPEIDSHATSDTSSESHLGLNKLPLDASNADDFVRSFLELNYQQSLGSSSDAAEDGPVNPPARKAASIVQDKAEKPVKSSRRKKSRQRDDVAPERSNKNQATSNEDYVEMEQYDDVFLCSEYENKVSRKFSAGHTRDSPGRINRGKKDNSQADQVDLTVILNQCAQAVSTFDLKTANELLRQIRQHCSPYGDSTQRLAHHVANGLEARIAGTGSTISTDIVDLNISTSEILKAYKQYVSAIPFKRMSYFLANNAILKVAENATKIHVIDFGVFLGLQWPCFIKALSKRPGGPPTLRITGIDFPQKGFRPAERIDATGRRLSGYCERFGVPFEYQGIAAKWENIQPEDLKIESDELLIVNCMFRSGTLLDETVDASSPRDAFLRLVRNLKPKLFTHGVINGTFNAPFFLTRFKEALFHYASVFEVFEATLPRQSHERLLIESEIFGKEVYNVVACEGVERLQRPETYRQWQIRQARAGLSQLPIDRELVGRAKAMIKANYHNDFIVDVDRHWMLQGWKGRIFCALSFWQPS